MTPSWLGTNAAKITVNVMDFGLLGTAVTPLATKRRISNICHYFKI